MMSALIRPRGETSKPLLPAQSRIALSCSADRPEPEVEEDLRADAVVAEVGREAEAFVGLDGVGTRVLERVGLELVEEADAPALLAAQVDDHAATGGVDAGRVGGHVDAERHVPRAHVQCR